jgi:hypothetical protein
MSTQNHTLKSLPPPSPPAVERYSLQYLCRQTSPSGIPTVLICMPHGSSTRKQNTGECNPTPQSLGHTAITGSDTTPWGNKHHNHWARHHTMRSQTLQSLGQTPHHEATNAAITGSDTTPWSHKCRDHWVRHHTMKPQMPRSLGQTPHHEATNADKQKTTTVPTEESSKKTSQFDIHL